MGESQSGICPLCGGTATIELTNHGNDEDVLCSSCGRYTISWQAKRIITENWWPLKIEAAQIQIKGYQVDHKIVSVTCNALTNEVFIKPL